MVVAAEKNVQDWMEDNVALDDPERQLTMLHTCCEAHDIHTVSDLKQVSGREAGR